MKNTYCLQIVLANNCDAFLVDKVLKIEHNTPYGWELEIEEGIESIDYINFFLDILEGKYEALDQIGIGRDLISIWRYYEYDEQCNFEFSPKDLKRMGDNGITLCLSCWDSGEQYEHDAGFEKKFN